MHILVVTHYANALRGFATAAEELDHRTPGWGHLTLVNCASEPDGDAIDEVEHEMADADVVLVDLMGCSQQWVDAVGRGLKDFHGQFIPTGAHFTDRTRLGDHQSQAPGSRPGDGPHARMVRAYRSMRPGDAEHILTTLLHDHGGRADIEVSPASEGRPGVHLGDPRLSCRHESIEEYCREHGGPEGRSVVAVIHSSLTYPVDKVGVAAALVQALEPYAWVLPIAVETDAASALDRVVELCTTPGLEPAVLVNLIGFRFGAGPMGGRADAGEEALERIDACVVSPLILGRRTRAQWQADRRGLDPSDLLVSVMLPEFDGATNQVPVAAVGEDAATRAPVVMEDQVQHLAGRVRGLLRLRRLANASKRVALVGYDHPGGEGRLLAASQLDVAASISAILANLAEHGYTTTPVSPDRLRADLEQGSVNSSTYGRGVPERAYSQERARADLDQSWAWREVDEHWAGRGIPPMTDAQGAFLVPGVEYGNVLVGVQPGRGEQSASAAHDNTMPPHPQYLAYYTWLREVWRADVIVHVGTHGTFEFLKSRENAVGKGDFPDLMLGNMPHVYLYYAGNPAEALVARRRSHAVVVSHQPPVFTPGGLHGDIEELAGLVEAWRRSRDLTPQASDDLRDQIAVKAAGLHWPTDPQELETELERLGDQLVPVGLHVFGTPWTSSELASMVALAVRETVPGATVAEAHGEQRVRDLVALALEDATPDLDGADDAECVLVSTGRDIAARFARNDEWDGLHRALSGRHVASRLGGDVVHDPDVLPSGHSLHQFDPRQVPSPAAAQRGTEMARQLRAAHRAEHHGAEPRCVGLVLWGLETTRTHGETYAQVLSLLGVRSRRATRPGQQRWEVIPTDELPGPRVDVVLTISGFFRDLYAALADDLDDIIAAVSALDEPEEVNPIAARTRAIRERLLAQGMDVRDAEELSRARVFGPPPGLYSTGLAEIVDEGAWETTAELAEHFTLAAHHVYSRTRHGIPAPDLYRDRLGEVELVAQSRSTNEHHVTDLDHYFEFLGGMGAAVAARRGAPVPVLVTDTTGRRVHTGTLGEATRMGLHAQLLNPVWTQAMLAHGHQGVGEISERTTNLLGLAATAGEVDDWMFDAVFDRYMGDEDMLQRLQQANPHATAQMADRLGEAEARGLWQACPERRSRLVEILLTLESDLEGGDG